MFFLIIQLCYSSVITCLSIFLVFMIKKRRRNVSQIFSEPQNSVNIVQSPIKRVQQRKESGLFQRNNMKERSIKRKTTIRVADNLVQAPKLSTRKSEMINTNQYINTLIKDQKLKRAKSIKEELNQETLKIPNQESKLNVQGNSQTQLPELNSEREQINNFFGTVSANINNPQKFENLTYLVFMLNRIIIELIISQCLYYQVLDNFVIIPVSLGGGVLLRILEKYGLNWIVICIMIIIHTGSYFTLILLSVVDETETYIYLIILGIECVLSLVIYIILRKLK